MADSKPTSPALHSVIGVFVTTTEAGRALTQLEDAGYAESDVSVVGKGVRDVGRVHGWIPDRGDEGYYGAWGTFWSALSGWIPLGFVWLPGIGWVAAGGWLASALVSGGIGKGLTTLTGLAVSDEDIPGYETDLKADRYLVVVHGDETSVQRADEIFAGSSPLRVNRFAV